MFSAPFALFRCGKVARMSPPEAGELDHQSLKARLNGWVVPSVYVMTAVPDAAP